MGRKKLSRKTKIWKKFCNLPKLEKYELVLDMCVVYDDFWEMLHHSKDFYGSLKELEKDVNERHNRSKK